MKHSSCGDLTSLQRSVGHSIEPVDALVLKEIASGYNLSFTSAIRRVVTNPECEPASWLFCAAPSYLSSKKSSLKTNRLPGPPDRGQIQQPLGRDNAYKDLHAGHRSLGPELFFQVSAGAIGSHPRFSVRKEPDCAQAGRFSRRLQLAPGLVPPTSWSPPPVSALDLVTR